MEEGEPSTVLVRSVLLRASVVEEPGQESLFWYKIDVSDNEASSILQPCYKVNVKKMEKEAKRREVYEKKKMNEYRKKRFLGEEIEEEEEEHSNQIVSPICRTEGISYESFWTVLGSLVYCFGAKPETVKNRDPFRFSHSVRFWDFFDVEKGLDRAPPMINKRLEGKAVTLNGHIYVFGGVKSLSSKPWAEVYENCEEWKALKEPPIFFSHDYDLFAFSLDDGGRILIFSHHRKGLFTYNVSEDSWNVVDKFFELQFPCYSEPVVARNCLYWVGEEVIWAYDMHKKVLLSGRTHFWPLKNALNIASLRRRSNTLPFFHLHGDSFCIIWTLSHYGSGHPYPRSVFVCHTMRILKRSDEGEGSLSIKPVSIQYFLINEGSVQSFDGILLAPGSNN